MPAPSTKKALPKNSVPDDGVNRKASSVGEGNRSGITALASTLCGEMRVRFVEMRPWPDFRMS